MSTTPAELENSIQLALEAATAANDSAEDVARLSSDTLAAAERLDKFAKGMQPLLLGVVAAAVLCVGLAGLVYLRTLSDMRTATATQIEALTVFSKSVGDLQAQLTNLEGLAETVTAIETAQTAGQQRLEEALTQEITRLSDALTDESEGDPAAPQMLRSLSEALQTSHRETREAFAQGLSDLQLALTRMLADRPEVAKPATQSTTNPAKSAARTPTRKKPQARAEPNPFGFP